MERIVLGSGKLYVDEFTGELPEDAAIEVEAIFRAVRHCPISRPSTKRRMI